VLFSSGLMHCYLFHTTVWYTTSSSRTDELFFEGEKMASSHDVKCSEGEKLALSHRLNVQKEKADFVHDFRCSGEEKRAFFLKDFTFKKDDRLALSHYFQCSEGEKLALSHNFRCSEEKRAFFS
jgi:hypothetical protein